MSPVSLWALGNTSGTGETGPTCGLSTSSGRFLEFGLSWARLAYTLIPSLYVRTLCENFHRATLSRILEGKVSHTSLSGEKSFLHS